MPTHRPFEAALIPLEAWDMKRHMAFGKNRTNVPNGIACPKCGAELVDNNPSVVLLTYPGKVNVHCPSCEWVGTRVV